MEAKTSNRGKPETKLYTIDLCTRFTTHFNETGKKSWTLLFSIHAVSLLNPILLYGGLQLESGLPA